MLRLGVVGTPSEVAAHIEGLAKAGADTVYFHIYDPADPDHVRLLGEQVAPLVS
jgi:alkanesulfonate monooxygenase SsuD/methylene tetrahydromethanopterin reductase-like flavin-dependent oxidoreductase (luciferase family)